MATAAQLRKKIDRLVKKYDRRISAAFQESIRQIRSDVVLSEIVRHLENGNVAAAVDAVRVTRAAYAPLEREIAAAFTEAGTATTQTLPFSRTAAGDRLVVRFDARNVAAERWLSSHSSDLVVEIVSDQRESIRRALESGLQAGRNPRATANEVVGKISRITGRREGGILGITSGQAKYVSRASLELSGETPEGLRNYLTRNRRDRRFDHHVRRALETGKPIPADVQRNMVGRYADRLLKLRGEVIARSETLWSMHAGKHSGMSQAFQEAGYVDTDVTKTWRDSGDERVRHSHQDMDGQTVVGLEGQFVTRSGHRLRFPGDRSLGAPASEVIQCRCDVEYDINFSRGVS